MRSLGLARLSLALPLALVPALLDAQAATKLNRYGNPPKVSPAPTAAGNACTHVLRLARSAM